MPSLAGVTFELFADANANDKVDTGETLGQKTTTATGTLTWGGLPWRTDYKVLEVSWPTGYVPSGDLVTGPYTIERAPCPSPSRGSTTGSTSRSWTRRRTRSKDGSRVETARITYTITVKNEGALPLTNQTLVDTLPIGVALDVASVNPAGDTSVAGKITWKFDLGGFSQQVFTYKVTVLPTVGRRPAGEHGDVGREAADATRLSTR